MADHMQVDDRKPVMFASITIRSKLILNAAIPLAIFAAFAVWLQLSMHSIERQIQSQLQGEVKQALVTKDLAASVIQVQQYLQDVAATRAQDGLDSGFAEAAKARDAFQQQLQLLREMSVQAPSRQVELQRLSQQFDAYYAVGVKMAKAYVEQGPSGGNPMMADFDRVSSALQKSTADMVASRQAAMQATLVAVESQGHHVRLLALGLCAFLALVVASISWVIYRSVVRPIQVASAVAVRISKGDLRHQFMPKGRDEIGTMLSALALMQDELRALVERVKTAVDGVSQMSSGIADANLDLSSRTERQAAAVEQTAASMQQLAGTVRQNAESAVSAQGQAEKARHVATTGGELISNVEQTMRGISQSSARVSEITSVIDGMAFQTNLLALNAAVEAARAGEHGRGFAVVANEVRQLASRSAEAAKEIRGLILGSQAQVQAGAELVERTGAVMREVVASTLEVSQLVQSIAHGSREQSEGISQVVAAVAHIDDSTQQNAALVEETAATTDSLRKQAEELVDAVRVFSIDGVVEEVVLE